MNGVTFGSKHSFKDWGLILKSRPEISPPKPKVTYIDIPEADGQLDLTESLTGNVVYENRIIKCEFNVIDGRNRWSTIYSDILDFLHGQRIKVIFDEDPAFYYIGRLQVDEWKSDKKTSVITISGDVEPYKYELFSSTEDWVWDSFNFENGIVRNYSNIPIDGSYTLNIEPTRRVVSPTIIVHLKNADSTMSVRYGFAETYNLSEGVNNIPEIEISQKNQYNFLRFEGQGTVTVEYRGGRL